MISDAFLDALRKQGDPPADEAVEALFSGGDEAVQRANLLLREMVDNDDVPSRSLPEPVRDFFLQGALPAFADPRRIELGQELFLRYGPLVITLLNLYSLPFSYCAVKGVKVLARTGRLHSNPTRRITETAQMVIDVMSPGGLDFDPGRFGAGVRGAQKVRLMHATIRYLIQRRDPSWDRAWGVPVNQEDMAGTMLSFSGLVMEGLMRLGVGLSRAEQDAYVHTWNVVGALMGVRPELLPADYEAAAELGWRIWRRNAGPSAEGRELTDALLKMLEHLVPGNLFDGVPARLMRYLLQDEAADLLGVPTSEPGDFGEALRWLTRAVDAAEDESALLRGMAELFGRALMHGLLLVFRGGHRQPFDIPTELRQVWGVNWKPLR